MKRLARKVSDRAAEWIPPWTGGSRLLTLWDMKEYLAPRLVRATSDLCAAMFGLIGELTPEKRAELKETLSSFSEETAALGLPLTHKATKGLAEAVNTETTAELERRIEDVQSRFDDEAENLTLFYVHADALKFYNKTDLFGEPFKENFPTANAEITEAGNCFAFDRFSAAVFHLTHALEIALRVLFLSLGMPAQIWSVTKWQKILRRIEGKIKWNNERLSSNPEWQRDRPFYEKAHAFLAAAANPLRNSSVHVDVTYNDESSVRPVWLGTEAFMRHLATRLKEQF